LREPRNIAGSVPPLENSMGRLDSADHCGCRVTRVGAPALRVSLRWWCWWCRVARRNRCAASDSSIARARNH